MATLPSVFCFVYIAPAGHSSSLLPIATPLPVIFGKDGLILILHKEHGPVGYRSYGGGSTIN